MNKKILQVFYGADALPYKDKERTVHFPIVGNAIQNANNTTQIKFYFDRLIEENEQTTFVAVSKLPNGKIGSKILETYDDEELGEQYALLDLDSFYTQYKGDVFISLQGYQGGVRVEQDEQGIYQIYGTPVIAATGSIKLAINYAPSFVGSGETENVTLQQVLGELSTKLGVRQETLHVEELPTVGNPDIWYVVNDDEDDPNKANIYIWNATTQSYVWVGDNTLDLGDYYTTEQGEQFENNVNETLESYDDRIENVESELSSVAQGSPKGAYDTLEDLQTAYPTGDNNIYLVGTHWYYWNGSAWTDGGLYLSSGEDVEKLQNQMDFVLNDHSFFYNENVTVTGTGTYESKSYYFPVEFEETTKVTLKIDSVIGYTTNDCLYMYALDENDQVLAQTAIYMTGDKTVSINCPNTTKRIRVQFYPASGTAMPTGSATYYGVLCYWGDIPRYIETSKLNPDLQKSVDDLTKDFNDIVTDNAFIYKEDLVVSGDGTYVSKNYDFEVNFETQTKVTLHIDNIVGNTVVDCAYLYALDENDATISLIAIYWGIRDTVSLDCPTTTKKIRVQLYPASGIAMPTGYATFYGVTCYFGVLPLYIDSSKVYPRETLHVGAKYKYKTIQSAVNDAVDGDTIIIHEGTYDESVKVYGETQNIHTSAKNLRFIGTNRDSCILTHSISDYANPPLEIAMGYVENLTIIGTGDTTIGQFAYCVHMDFGTSMYKNIQFNNCRFVNTKYPCIGTGIREGQKEYFLNCVFECDYAAAFLFHEDQNNNVTNNSITFDGCTFVSNSPYDATIHVQETSTLTGNYLSVTFRRNIVKHTNNGQLVRLYELNNGEINGDGWLNSNTYHLTIDSDLNSDGVFDYD